MENRVGDSVPKKNKLDAIYAGLKTGVDGLRRFCITLTDEERQSLVHPRKNGEEKVEKAADICTRYGITIPGVPVQGMLNDLRLARAMRPFRALLESALQLAKDTEGQAESEYWTAFLALYGAINNAAAHNPELAAEAKDLVEFMKVGKRKKAEEDATEEPAKNGPAKNEPAKNEPAKNEPAKNEPAKNS